KKVAKPAPKPVAKAIPKPVAKPVAKPAPKVEVTPEVPAPKKSGKVDPKSLVSIKQKVKPVIKKEPPKPTKVVIPKTTTKSSVKYEPDFTKSVLDQSIPQYNGPTMRYSDNDLVEFREIITRKLDAAKKELTYLQGLITRKEEGGDMDEGRYMTMEDGSVSMEREQLSQMASRQITFIDHLEKAMMRIENKTYGICRVTGNLIDKARLRAVPHATLSIEAKQTMNK
ncbi:MAG TPA: TraR/DksA C4-type zinc finger protein, partial [Chitinophagaceae bacterium]|nr:TraR/DksA C4-type zinc finger protein [Chitinophagaceae bacterium]